MSKIYQDQGRRVFGIQFVGSLYRYYFRGNPFIDDNLNGLAYIDSDSLISLGDYSCDIELSGGIANYSPIDVSLAVSKDRLTSSDPSVIFGRLPKSSSVWIGQVTQDINRRDNTPSIYVDREPRINGQPIYAPCHFYIGSETFYVTTIADIGGGQYRLDCSQRIGFRQDHLVLKEGTDVPIISNEIVGWRGRLVDIYVGYMDENGNVSDKKVLYRGMIESSPSFNANVCSLSILPITAILDNKISAVSRIGRLARGGHYFDNNPKIFFNINVAKKDGQGHEWYTGTFGILINDTKKFMSNVDILSKINTLGNTNLPKYSIVPKGSAYEMRLGFSNWVDEDQGSGNWVFTSVVFPQHNMMWEDFVRGQYSSESMYVWNSITQLYMIAYTDGSAIYTQPSIFFYPSSLIPKFIFTAYDFSGGGETLKTLDKSNTPDIPEGSDLRSVYKVGASLDSQLTNSYEVRGLADGYYLYGEDHILFEDSMGLPSSNTGKSYTLQARKGDQVFYFKATHEELTDYGYLVYLDKSDTKTMMMPPLYDFPDDSDRWEFRLALSISKNVAIASILQILESGGGDRINGDFDIQGMGANLPAEYIDIGSISSLGSLGLTDQWEFSIPVDDIKIRDIIDPLLKTMGCALVMKRGADRVPKLTLIPIGIENANIENDIVVSDDDFLIEPPPEWDILEDVITQFEFKYNYHKKEPDTANFFNHNIINRLSGETAKETYELRGLTDSIIGGINQTEVYNYLLPSVARLFNLYGEPHRLWRFSLGSGKSLELDCCSTVKITSSNYLKAYDDDISISNKSCRIIKMRVGLMNEGADIEAIHYGKSSPTWNVAGRIVSIPSSNSITIQPNWFSDDDISYFKVGDVVRVYYMSIHDNSPAGSLALTISQIDNVLKKITFTTNHSLILTTSYIVPASYDLANEDHKVRAYISDLNNELGINNDKGYEYE